MNDPRKRNHDRRPPRSKSHSSTDRGVSEVISFVLTFSMITMMIGLLYSGGTVTMQQLQTGNQIQNAEGVFFVVADSFNELQEGQAPRRAGSLDLDVGASLAIENRSSVNVTVNGPGYTRTIPTRSLVYRLDDRKVTYETGAVFRTNDDDSVLIGEPSGIFCSPESNSSVVSVVTLVQGGSGSVASGTVTITGIQQSNRLIYPNERQPGAAVENVTINVTSTPARDEVWEEYLRESDGWVDDDGDGTFACESADHVFVRHTVIKVQFTV